MASLLTGDPFTIVTTIIAILIALSVHEWAHAFVANRLGDPTAEREGRLTLNPVAHLDPMGAIVFLLVGFGWAKPVPVNPSYFARPKRDMALVALAGPVSNVILALIAVILLIVLPGSIPTSLNSLMAASSSALPLVFARQLLLSLLFLNLGLAAFNLLPIAPLDGSKILQLFIPWKYEEAYEQFLRVGPMVLLALIIAESFLPIRLVSGWVNGIVSLALHGIDAVLRLLA